MAKKQIAMWKKGLLFFYNKDVPAYQNKPPQFIDSPLVVSFGKQFAKDLNVNEKTAGAIIGKLRMWGLIKEMSAKVPNKSSGTDIKMTYYTLTPTGLRFAMNIENNLENRLDRIKEQGGQIAIVFLTAVLAVQAIGDIFNVKDSLSFTLGAIFVLLVTGVPAIWTMFRR